MNSQGRLNNNSKCGVGRIEAAFVVFIVGVISALETVFLSFPLFCLPFNSMSVIQRSPCFALQSHWSAVLLI